MCVLSSCKKPASNHVLALFILYPALSLAKTSFKASYQDSLIIVIVIVVVIVIVIVIVTVIVIVIVMLVTTTTYIRPNERKNASYCYEKGF